MRLPLELVEVLVQNLSDDAASLKACSLISSTFLATSQRRLLDTLVISPPTSTKPPNGTAEKCRSPTTKVCDLLRCSPHLSAYIQHLRLEDAGKVTTDANGLSTHWLAQDPCFARLLPLLHAVKSVVWNSGVCGLNWYTLPPSTRQALQTALARWPLERFDVQAMFNLPLPVIKTMRNLQHLSLSMVHFVEKELPQNAALQVGSEGREDGNTPLRLKSLSIADPSRHLLAALSTWIVDNVDLVGLEELNWNTYGSYFPKGQDMVEVLRILEPAAESIRTLSITPSLDGTSTSAIPSLSLPPLDYPKLQNLALGFELSSFNPSSSLWFKTSLGNIANSGAIAHLEKVDVRCQIAQGNPAASFDPSVWVLQSALVHPVTGQMKAGRLKEVNVQLHTVYSGVQDEMVEIRQRIEDGLEPLSGRIRVSVTEVVGQT